MSGIYIIGMEMPKSCDDCNFESIMCCFLLKKRLAIETFRKGERDKDCPLVEVPPHGRLIDEDALQLKLLTAESGKVYDYCYPCKEVLQAIKDSPTIIERETN